MQDWSYVWHNDLQITVELSHQKWPNYSEIPQFYKNNRDSMVYFLKAIHRGAGFKFKEAKRSGIVQIRQTSPVVKDLGGFTFKNSEFYKVMPEGEYVFSINEGNNSSPKVITVNVEKDIITTNGNYVLLD